MLNATIITVYLLLFGLLLKRWSFFSRSGIKTSVLWIIFTLKFVASLVLAYIYSKHYPERAEADIFKYYDDAQVMFSALSENPRDYFKMLLGVDSSSEELFNNYFLYMNNWDRAFDSNIYNDSHTIIRFNAFIRLFSFGVYQVHSLFFIMFSMIGLVGIYRFFKDAFVRNQKIFLLALFLMPSIFIWSSGVLKESILIMALGLLLFAIQSINSDTKFYKKIPLGVLSIVLLMYIKFYVLIAFLPVVLCFLIARKVTFSKPIVYGFGLSLMAILAFNAKHVPPHVDMLGILERKQSDFKRLAEWQHAGSEFELTDIEPSFIGVVKVVPEGVFNCFFRPFPWNATSALYYPSILENLIVLGFLLGIIIAVFHKQLYYQSSHQNLLMFCFCFSILLFIIIGVTTPVAGALVRYKVPALPFLFGAMIYLLQNSKNFRFIESKLPELVES